MKMKVLSLAGWTSGLSAVSEVQELYILADTGMNVAGAVFRIGAYGVFSGRWCLYVSIEVYRM